MTAATAAAPSTSVVEDPPFKKTEPMAYAIGDIGNGFYFQLVTNYALIYMTDALGINPVIAGMIIFVGKLISAFTDFGTGVWADNAPLRKDGRYHWFVRTLRYPLMAVIILTFLPFVSSWPMTLRIVYITVIYILGVAATPRHPPRTDRSPRCRRLTSSIVTRWPPDVASARPQAASS